jgi:hypothetical protein
LTNGPVETQELYMQLLTYQAAEALVKFAQRYELSNTADLSLLLSFGSALAEMAITGKILYHDGTATYQIIAFNGSGQMIAG